MTHLTGMLASLSSPGDPSVTSLFLIMAALVTAARLGGSLALRLGQPGVLGELIAGILIGPSLLGVVDPTLPAIHLLSEFGVVILLFQIGLHTDLRALRTVGPASLTVGVVGVVLPFVAGYAVAHWLGVATLPAIVVGASMTATSIGITVRILDELHLLDSREGKTVLGAAVIDDVIGLIILAVVTSLASGGAVTALSVGRTVALAIGFLVVTLVVGERVAPRLFRLIDRLPGEGSIGALALAFALVMAAAADLSGSAMIIGAFAAGLVLPPGEQRHRIETATAPVGHFFVPIFFASVGAAVDVRAMLAPDALQLGAALLLVGIVTKVAAGHAPFWIAMHHRLVGVAMVPRGEVGLIFAQMGLTTAVLSGGQFGAIMLMVMGTTMITPPWLSRFRTSPPR
jgi:Kef-type K+ transport system membrane component KefB